MSRNCWWTSLGVGSLDYVLPGAALKYKPQRWGRGHAVNGASRSFYSIRIWTRDLGIHQREPHLKGGTILSVSQRRTYENVASMTFWLGHAVPLHSASHFVTSWKVVGYSPSMELVNAVGRARFQEICIITLQGYLLVNLSGLLVNKSAFIVCCGLPVLTVKRFPVLQLLPTFLKHVCELIQDDISFRRECECQWLFGKICCCPVRILRPSAHPV